MVFLPKNDGKLRFLVDYSRLHLKTVVDSYALPNLDDLIHILRDNSAVFYTMVASCKY